MGQHGARLPVRVRLDGVELWWLKNGDGSGALAPLDHCNDAGEVEVFADSYAYVTSDGRILRYHEEIGHRDDLEIVS